MKWVCVLASLGLLCCVEAYDDSRCCGRGGGCQYTSSSCSGGQYHRSLCGGPSNRQCCIPDGGGGGGLSDSCPQAQQDLACKLLKARNVIKAKRHPSGKTDNAYPYNNLRDVCQGKQASRSSYYCGNGCHAPGGTTCLSLKLLTYLDRLATTGITIRVNELAGACHSCNSRHYSGLAADLHRPTIARGQLYENQCRALGGWALNEATHVHCQFYDGPHPNWQL